MSETSTSPPGDSAFKDFLQKAKQAMDVKNFKGAVASLNIAGKILSDLRAAGVTIAEDDVSEFKSLVSTANEAAERQDQAVKEKTASQLTVLRQRGTSNEATGKDKKAKIMSIFLFGLDAAGKTTFVDYINKERFIDHSPTVGVSISRIALGTMKFVFNDVGGQEKYREKWRNYWKKPDFMLFIVDASDGA
nr:ADP-ribosylation factor-like protein [Candidatus Sigynarchaeota archaeon]